MHDVYLYSGGFIEFLNLTNILLHSNIKPYYIKNEDYEPNLFDRVIKLDIEKDNNIIKEYINIFGIYNFRAIYYVYISNHENKETIIYYYLLNYFKYGKNLNKMYNLKCVSEVLKLSKNVLNENHRLKGFLRFKELNNHILYAEINPTNNILFLLSLHFKKRLKNEYWVIKDVNRKILSIYDKNNFYIVNADAINLFLDISEKEIEFEKLWQTFYKKIGITERKNDRCRMNFMPKKYWKYMVEMENEE